MRRRKNKKQVRVVIGLSICLLLIMTVGYAAFSTNLTISAKGNIHNLTTVEKIKNNVVTSGDGLYVDTYEEGRYVYKGGNPDNYVKFSNSLWRIVSIENDNAIKIKKQVSIGTRLYDEAGLRDSSSNGAGGTYCAKFASGCNAWAKSDSIVGNYSGTVLLDASLNTYLNRTYYNSLSEEKMYIQPYNFRIGFVNGVDLPILIEKEKSIIWNGKIAMLNMSDFFRATNNSGCNVLGNGYWKDNSTSHDYYLCSHDNFLYINNNTKFLNPYTDGSISGMGAQGSIGSVLGPTNTGNNVYPVLYLKSDIKLSGSGTELDPYIIKS